MSTPPEDVVSLDPVDYPERFFEQQLEAADHYLRLIQRPECGRCGAQNILSLKVMETGQCRTCGEPLKLPRYTPASMGRLREALANNGGTLQGRNAE